MTRSLDQIRKKPFSVRILLEHRILP